MQARITGLILETVILPFPTVISHTLVLTAHMPVYDSHKRRAEVAMMQGVIKMIHISFLNKKNNI